MNGNDDVHSFRVYYFTTTFPIQLAAERARHYLFRQYPAIPQFPMRTMHAQRVVASFCGQSSPNLHPALPTNSPIRYGLAPQTWHGALLVSPAATLAISPTVARALPLLLPRWQ